MCEEEKSKKKMFYIQWHFSGKEINQTEISVWLRKEKTIKSLHSKINIPFFFSNNNKNDENMN